VYRAKFKQLYSTYDDSRKDAGAQYPKGNVTEGNENTVGYATTNECYNEEFLSIKSGSYNERFL
jgi:hypothetical protein